MMTTYTKTAGLRGARERRKDDEENQKGKKAERIAWHGKQQEEEMKDKDVDSKSKEFK